MEKETNKKIILLSFVIAGFLTALVVSVLLEAAAASFGSLARLYAQDIVKHGIPVIGGLGLFLYLQFNKGTRTLAEEAVVEIRKVVWPSQKDTSAMTVVVCIMLLISGVVLGVFDFLSTSIVKNLIN